MIKRLIYQEDITITNTYAPNTRAPKYIKQLLNDLQGEKDCNTIVVCGLNTPLSTMNRLSRQKINEHQI
jgi:hypothetical protein